jgi:hypothetical protein
MQVTQTDSMVSRYHVTHQPLQSHRTSVTGMFQIGHQLRAIGLGTELPSPPQEFGSVSRAVIDYPASGGFVTLVATWDGTASIYTYLGGATMGVGTIPRVVEASRHLLSAIKMHIDEFPIGNDDGFPGEGMVRFHVLDSNIGHVVDLSSSFDYNNIPHPLGPVMAATLEFAAAVTAEGDAMSKAGQESAPPSRRPRRFRRRT